MAAVLAAHEESLRPARAVCEGRDEFAKDLVQVAKEDGGHKTLAKLFHDMFPDRLTYLGKVDGWYSFQAPRWWRIKGDVEYIITLIHNEFSGYISMRASGYISMPLLPRSAPTKTLSKRLTLY